MNHTGSNESPEYLISFDALASLNPESVVLVSELVDVTARCAITNQCAPCGHVPGLYPGSSPPNCTLIVLESLLDQNPLGKNVEAFSN